LIVLDASAAVCLLLNSPPPRAAAIAGRLHAEDIHAPHLIDLEILQTLKRAVLGGQLTVQQADTAVADLGLLPLTRYPHYALLDRTWELRDNLSIYDASYVALADFLNAPLLTLAARIARAGVRVPIELF
jgi:predicted nucleic acid-binding protein